MSYFYKKHSLILPLICCFFLFKPVHAQVVINEYSAGNGSTVADNFGEYNDWVELYNAGTSSVTLTGYHMSDKASNPVKYTFPSGTTIAAGGFLRVICSGRDMVSAGWYHSNFKLTQCAPEQIVF